MRADFISLHTTITDATKVILNTDSFSKMKNDVRSINCARGGLIGEEDLKVAIEMGKVAGAGIDVFEIEPPNSNNPLFTLDNILLSPHNAALTLECRKRMAIETIENIVFYLEDHSKLNKQNIINRKIFNL